MASATYVISLLQNIKEKSNECLRNNEHARYILDKVSENLNESCRRKVNGDVFDNDDQRCGGVNAREKTVTAKSSEDLEHLENILRDKLQENARLKTMNDKLLASSRQKSSKIKELTNLISQQSQQSQKSTEISKYKDKIGQYNVEIQKMKKQLSVETKKLQNEKANISRLEKSSGVKPVQERKGQLKSRSIFSCKNLIKDESEISKMKSLFEELDEFYQQRTTEVVTEDEEPSIMDETLDMPESLDSDSDETSVVVVD